MLLAFCSIVVSTMVVSNRRNPGSQAARRAGLEANAPQPGQSDQDVNAIVSTSFTEEVLNTAWPHHPTPLVVPNVQEGDDPDPAVPDTHKVAARLLLGLTWLKTALQVCPNDLIVHDEELSGRSHFTRTERSFMNGIVAIIAVKIVYGNHAFFRHDLAGGIVDFYIAKGDFSGRLLAGLVTVIFEKLNIENHKGFVLQLESIRQCNYSNFMKNFVKRARDGIYSDDFVLEVQRAPTHELHGNAIMVRGIYFGYYKILCMVIRGFAKKATQAHRGAYVTDAENAEANWRSIHNAALPF